MEKDAQTLPVRVSQGDKHLLLVTPMPGIKPADISITIAGHTVRISGYQTGPGQDEKNLLIEEWKMGPYYREIELPQAINGALTNATFGNGILTLAMPKASGESDSVVTFQLESIDAARGERIGHNGIGIEPV